MPAPIIARCGCLLSTGGGWWLFLVWLGWEWQWEVGRVGLAEGDVGEGVGILVVGVWLCAAAAAAAAAEDGQGTTGVVVVAWSGWLNGGWAEVDFGM